MPSMDKATAIRQARINAEKQSLVYAVVRNPYIGGWWVVTLATAKANGLRPIFTTPIFTTESK